MHTPQNHNTSSSNVRIRKPLRDTKWLAELLGVSVSTIEKRRAYFPETLPKHIRVGRLIRYDEDEANCWLDAQQVK